MLVVIAIVFILLLAVAIGYVKSSGRNRVLISRAEKPERFIGTDVQFADLAAKPNRGWLSPPARVVSHDGSHYRIEFERPWESPHGTLAYVLAREGMPGNALSLLSEHSGSIPAEISLPRGGVVTLDLCWGYEPDDTWDKNL